MAGLLERSGRLGPLGGLLVDKALGSEVQHSTGKGAWMALAGRRAMNDSGAMFRKSPT